MTTSCGRAAVFTGLLALGPALLVPAAAGAQAPDACKVAAIAPLLAPSAGIAVSPADEQEVVVAKLVGATYQLVRIDLRNRQEHCVTCKRTATGPAVDRDKAAPSILPATGALLMQVQQPPGPAGTTPVEASWLNDLWMATRDGERWWNLTRYPASGAGRAGALLPVLAPDGRHLAYAEYRPAEAAPWRIRIARIDSGADGSPSLRQLAPVAIEGASVYEPLAWSLDGRALLFAADTARRVPGGHDLWVHDLADGRTGPLGGAAERFGALAPNGRTLALAAEVEAPNGTGALRTDLHLASGDRRAPPERLTLFNEPGHPHAKDGPDGSNVGRARWSADGRTVWFERRAYDLAGRRVQTHLAQVRFAGPCGAAPVAVVATPAALPVPRPPGPAPAVPAPGPLSGEVPPDPSGGKGGRVGINTAASIQVNGSSRSFRIVAPEKLADGQPVGVVFAFHGIADSNRFMSFYTGLDEAAEKHGFLLIYPQARLGAWPLLIQWIAPDLAFFDALLAHLSRLYNVDRNRVYVTGMSNGAYFINLLTSHRAGVIAAMAMHSGGVGVLASNDVKYRRKYPVMIVHGSQDFIINVREGRHARVFYKERGHPVEYVEFPGLNHFWAYSLGINDRIWGFFQAHPKRG